VLQDLLAWDASARKIVPPAVEAMETRVDANLRAQVLDLLALLVRKYT
jgi:hypothetical protein